MTSDKPLAIASDHAGFALKEQIKKQLSACQIAFEDLGTSDECSTDYPGYAHAVATGICEGRYSRGILVCGTGLGMSMAANRHRGIRAAVCSDTFSARSARNHTDANILCLGSRVTGVGLASDIVEVFLEAPFEGGRHQPRIEKIEL